MSQLRLKHTFIYTFLGFLPLSFSLIFTPVYTRYLSTADYGLLNLFTLISGILVPFFGLGIDQAAGFLYWDYSKDKLQLKKFISTTILLFLVIAVALIALGCLAGPWVMDTFVKNGKLFSFWPYLLLALIYPFFVNISRTLLYYYRNEGNIKGYSFLNVSTLVLITIGSILGVVYFQWGSAGAVEGRTIGFCAVTLFFALFEIGRSGLHYDRSISRSLLKMGGPLFFSSLIGSVAYVFDRLVVEQAGTLDMLGIYGFSVTIASVIEILMGALSNSFSPGVYKIMLEEDTEQYEEMNFQLHFFLYLLIGIAVLVTAATPYFVRWFISPRFFESIQYIPLLCLSFIPRAFTQFFSLKFYKHKRTSYILYLNIVYLASVTLLGLLFYHYLSLKGVALAVFCSGMINMFMSYYLSMKLDPLKFKLNKLYIVFALLSVSILGIHFLAPADRTQYVYFLAPLVLFLILSFTVLRVETLHILNTMAGSMRKRNIS